MEKVLEKNLKARRADIMGRVRAIEEIVDGDNGPTEGEEKEMRDLLDQVDRIDKQLDVAKRVNALDAAGAESDGVLTERGGDVGGGEKRDKHGRTLDGEGRPQFRSVGEYLERQFYADVKPSEMPAELRDMSVGDGSKGGSLVPEKYMAELLAVDPEREIMAPGAMVIPADPAAPDAKTHWPTIAQSSTGVFGGMTFYWPDEGDAPGTGDISTGQITAEPHELVGYVTVSNKLLRNGRNASAVLSQILRQGVTALRDYVFIRGNGIGKPQGYQNSPAALTANRTTANDIVFADVLALEQSLLPDSDDDAIWVASQSAKTKILSLKDDSNQSVYVAGDIKERIRHALLGRELRFSGRVPTLGTQGDLSLIDRRYYLIQEGMGVEVEMSPHPKFLNAQTVIRIMLSFDGKLWLEEPVTLEDATTQVSPAVVLA